MTPRDDHADVAGRRRSRVRGRPPSTSAGRRSARWAGSCAPIPAVAGRRPTGSSCDDDGDVERASFTSATAERERHLTLNRTEDGYWLLDTGAGGARTDFAGSVDVDLAGSVTFNALPVRRLDLHRETGEHTLPVVRVAARPRGGGRGADLPRHADGRRWPLRAGHRHRPRRAARRPRRASSSTLGASQPARAQPPPPDPTPTSRRVPAGRERHHHGESRLSARRNVSFSASRRSLRGESRLSRGGRLAARRSRLSRGERHS